MRAITSTGPTGSPWTFAGNSGIAGNFSVFTGGNPLRPKAYKSRFSRPPAHSANPSPTGPPAPTR